MALPVAHSRSHIFQGKPYGVTWRLITSFPVKRLSNREKSLLPVAHARTPPFQENPFGVTCAHPSKENRFGVKWRLMTSHPVAMWVMRNGALCTCTITIVRKKARESVAHAQNILPVMWLPVTSFPAGPLPVTSLPVAPPEMWLCLCWYTTDIQLSREVEIQ